jgi:TRAP transporter TAXI family solute receptor
MVPRLSLLAITLTVLVLAACGGQSETVAGADAGTAARFISIGTGSTTGVYYPVGGAVAQLVNAAGDQHGIKASHESTGGSVYNIRAVLAGDLEFGLAQSDRQFQAVNGQAEWEGEPQDRLRAVCSFHPEVVTLVADAAITDLAALQGQRVNLGNAASGQRQNAIEILQTLGLDPEADIQPESLNIAEAPGMLQDGRIDAFFFTVGHPNGAITEVTTGARPVRLLPITGVDSLLAKYPYYSVTTIPAETYPKAVDGDQAVASIGMLTTLVTAAEVDADVVYAVTKAIFTNLEQLKSLHPALNGLSPEGMRSGLTAPLHPGAQRWFDEQAGAATE